MANIASNVMTEDFNSSIAGSNLYNNELIGCVAIYNVLSQSKTISSAKAMLIIPLMCHNGFLSYINRANTDLKSIEQLVIRKPELVSNFNERFYSLMLNSINSISILNSINVIEFSENNIKISEKKDFYSIEQTSKLGLRAKKIIAASPTVAKLLEDDVENLYLQLRVKL
ncbi:three component ABC system middle component [Jeotgalibacillus salarius]|uniref:Uncharacterized protein n=1 Tax=Jeotgalibacillus salarius TaxID=546023 RepID=A0A4Y8LLL2_9BACL|nr:three component ABC system middle component [Jeotgalibacillus salarius]TFE03846.1 hypothetical protein E2626_00530 [Jeotgalibacillus salarius]